ncbi:hypothetical protein [Hoeflea ulvae]|uniref:hypothetical protein n=1 Tax=Hoeflea ulvae TaxID=2983764 RepID=UPI002D1E411C|nr:hypothetical protein [Hoeflea ulvae]
MIKTIKIMGALCALVIVVAGCNSTEQTLQPIPGDQQAAAANTDAPSSAGTEVFPAGQGTAPGAPTPGATAGQTVSAPAGQLRGRIRFTPVIGAPVNAVTPLSRQLAVEARNRGLAILSASDTGGDHVLKGYFSADNFNGQTTVFYVWDVLDTAGARLHRIQGQESFPGGAGDPRASVPADVMERIAARSIADYVSWRGL